MEKASTANNYHHNPKLQFLARQLRNDSTKAEACMWKFMLRAKGLSDFAFRRQRPILNYIVDFVCFECMLVIEIDGISHTFEDASMRDTQKDEALMSIGFTVMRFTDAEVLRDMDKVYDILCCWLQNSKM